MGMEPASWALIAAAVAPALIGLGKEVFGGGTSQGDVGEAGARKMQDMSKAAGAYGAYRPDQADARMKAMSQQLSAFQGAGNMMQNMYGGDGKGAGGTYTPGGGGYVKPTDGYALPDGTRTPIDPRTGGPRPSDAPPNGWTQAEWEAQRRAMDAAAAAKTANGGTSGQGGTPPIIIPRETPTGAGSSGPMFTGPMAQSLAFQQPPPAVPPNAMAAMLAGKPRF